MRRIVAFVAIALFPIAAGAKSADGRCDSVRLSELPQAVRSSLLDNAEGSFDNVCRVRRGESVAYRAHGRGSGITVEVSSLGEVLWRHWSE
jgi:hypothetical protein